ncbi:HNH endonuclease [Falsirhodobacter sp. 20TX0035]|uniref:HNH endonuclease n=1 Tax=Falsirhodobacter sp. 20TX0035 TaxID=3022019 RepID=UPI00232D74D9|nr:HNH endonuclease [Falsirhodobacter sp. 20TX0035]MDB6454707.1 HNH endonuclease [Falsirhodobacter sp. 20TX0035]
MAAKELPSPEVLRQLLDYNPDTGRFVWKRRGIEWFTVGRFSAEWSMEKWNTRYAGQEAFASVDNLGYRQGTVQYVKLRAHRVAWAMHFGVWPTGVIDHINGDETDNRICNLRQASTSENGMNRGAQINSTSGVKGVCFDKNRGKWMASICRGSKRTNLGRFETMEAAQAAYNRAAAALHGDFARAV